MPAGTGELVSPRWGLRHLDRFIESPEGRRRTTGVKRNAPPEGGAATWEVGSGRPELSHQASGGSTLPGCTKKQC